MVAGGGEEDKEEVGAARLGAWKDGSATDRSGNSKRRRIGKADGMVCFHSNDFGMLLGNLSSSEK